MISEEVDIICFNLSDEFINTCGSINEVYIEYAESYFLEGTKDYELEAQYSEAFKQFCKYLEMQGIKLV